MAYEVGVRKAKATLSALLADVRRGETVTITDRGRAVARLVPVNVDRTPLASRIEQLEAMGWISPPGAPRRRLPAPVRLPDHEIAQRYLREDRNAGR